MLFIEKRNFIKPENLKHTSFIMDFNVEYNNKRDFFLKPEDWDKFTDYMNDKHPEELMVLEYPALRS